MRDKFGRFIKGIKGKEAGHWRGGLWGLEVICPYCNESHRISKSRFNETKSKKFYCCREHWKLDSKVSIKCLVCNKKKILYRSDRKIKNRGQFCSKKCARKATPTGKDNKHWQGGRIVDSKGYIRIWDLKKRRYVLEHRIVMDVVANPTIHIHHKNGIKSDNRPENLEKLTHSEHSTLENNKRWGNI